MICDEHGLDGEGRWVGQSALQAERLQVYWREEEVARPRTKVEIPT